MHAYGIPQPYRPIPSLQPTWRPPQNIANTPIYDSLYLEWHHSFRATPGDRSGEEELNLPAVYDNNQHGPYGTRTYSTHNTVGRQGHWQRVGSIVPPGPLLPTRTSRPVPPTSPMMGKSDRSKV